MHPVPCSNCGVMFMKPRPQDPECRFCNNCLKKGEPMSGVQLLINVDQKEQIEIEELCINAGVTISDYFINLHRTNMVFEHNKQKTSQNDCEDECKEKDSELVADKVDTSQKHKKKK